jgi:RNA polymerase sigma-70 factor (ECF subfamily)
MIFMLKALSEGAKVSLETFSCLQTLPGRGPDRLVQSDEELMAAFQAGERRAFDELFERYRERVWGFFLRRIGDAPRAEELAQDTFVAVLRAAGRYEPRASFRSYLFGIAFNVMSAWRRSSTRDDHAPAEAAEPAAPGIDPTSVLWVRRALAGLDEADREVLMLREYEQLRYDEIAALVGVPINTVRSRLFRARQALKAQLLGEGTTRG